MSLITDPTDLTHRHLPAAIKPTGASDLRDQMNAKPEKVLWQ
jgi:hypothetical protein